MTGHQATHGTAGRLSRVAALIDELPDAVSCAAAVSVDGAVAWEHAAGWADRQRAVPAGAGVPYCIASVTKPLVAIAVLTLVEQGAIQLDGPLADHLPAPIDTPVGTVAEVTVRRVLGHAAGLPVHMQFFYDDEVDVGRPDPAVAIARYGHTVVPPGERHLYSNLGYGLLSQAIQHVTGRPWEDVVADRVLAPLGMSTSWMGAEHRPGTAAARYGTDGVAYPGYDVDHPGASLGWASARDLVRLGDAVVGTGSLPLQAATREAMLRPVSTIDAGGAYGLGWILESWGPARVVRHGGSMGGVRASLTVLPDLAISIAVLANTTSSALPEAVTAAVLADLAPDVPAWPNQATASEPPRPLDDRLPGRWSGTVDTYAGAHPLTLEIGGGRVDATYRGQRSPATVVPGRRFVVELSGSLGTPDADRRPHRLLASLARRDESLDGFVTAQYRLDGDEGGRRGHRVGNVFSHHCRLERSA